MTNLQIEFETPTPFGRIFSIAEQIDVLSAQTHALAISSLRLTSVMQSQSRKSLLLYKF